MTAAASAPLPADTARALRPLFIATVFTGSFLLFLIQPMVARLALPSLGGSPNVWNTAMLFYQAALLAGYLYAHALSRLPVRAQWAAHMALFAVASFTLPIGLGLGGDPTARPTLWLLGALAQGIGLLFLVVAAQAPLMQAWFARSGDPQAHDPYFLYAASNAGSLLGLLAYPFLLEPLTGLTTQTALWSAGFALLIGLVAMSGWQVWRDLPADAGPRPDAERGPAPAWRERLLWVALAAVPSGLMLSTTTHITTDIMAMPLLWVLPLGLYLLSFILVFGKRGAGWTRFACAAAPPLLLIFGGATLYVIGRVATLYGLASLGLLFLLAVALHGTLAARRPAAGRLTEFYLWMALGGMLGGVFCALIAPTLFDWSYEHPLLLLAAALLIPAEPLTRRIGRWTRAGWGRWLLLGGAALAPLLAWQAAAEIEFGAPLLGGLGVVAMVVAVALLAVLAIGRPLLFAWFLAMLMLAMGGVRQLDVSTTDRRERSFFGVYTVEDSAATDTRRLLHGTTLHGVQSLEPAKALVPTSYYAPASGVGQAMRAAPLLFGPGADIAYVGLGTGTLSCYAQAGQRWTVYEIDPVIVRMAFDPAKFSFVSRCKPDLRVVVGDARLTLAKAPAGGHDLLAVDAFSSDAIPLHLLTREAFGVYKRALRADGVLLVHVSNRFLELRPVVAAIARDEGWTARELVYTPTDAERAAGWSHSMSDWIALTRTPEAMARFLRAAETATGRRAEWTTPAVTPGVTAWTDEHASILPTLKRLRLPGA